MPSQPPRRDRLPTARADAVPDRRSPLALLSRLAGAHTVLVLTALIGGVLFAGLTAGAAAVWDAVAEQDGIAGLDQPALREAIALRSPLADQALTAFTHLGGPLGMTILASLITLAMVWRWRTPTALILMVVAVAGSLSFTMIGKAVVGRERPPLSEAVPPYEHAFSFPSGHTLNSTVIAGMVAYLLIRKLRSPVARAVTVGLAVLWAVAMGLSRVFLGHHWLTDVVFAWLLGLAWLALLVTCHRLFLAVRRERRRQALPAD